MQLDVRKSLSEFFLVGINYRKSEAGIRGRYAVDDNQYVALLETAASRDLKELFVLSTCNRTEIYGFASSAGQLAELLCDGESRDLEEFLSLAYIKKGPEAARHLFQVAAGLDSQLLGDYEILSQIKLAAKFAKERGFVGAFTERLINSALQASKAVKTNTRLSGGTVSVSFSAIQYIRQHIPGYNKKPILLIGTGKIGKSTCKNIADYLGTRNVTLVNRTESKAQELAKAFGFRHAPMEALETLIPGHPIVITCTAASDYLINTSNISPDSEHILLDLSIPHNIDPSLRDLSNVNLVNVDELSRIKDETLKMRQDEVPKAEAIISQHLSEFAEWCRMRRNVPVLTSLKQTLIAAESCRLAQPVIANIPSAYNFEQRVQEILNTTALRLKKHNTRGCQYIQAINEFIA